MLTKTTHAPEILLQSTLSQEILQVKTKILQKGKTKISITGLKNIDSLVGGSSKMFEELSKFSEDFGSHLISKPSPQNVEGCKSR